MPTQTSEAPDALTWGAFALPTIAAGAHCRFEFPFVPESLAILSPLDRRLVVLEEVEGRGDRKVSLALGKKRGRGVVLLESTTFVFHGEVPLEGLRLQTRPGTKLVAGFYARPSVPATAVSATDEGHLTIPGVTMDPWFQLTAGAPWVSTETVVQCTDMSLATKGRSSDGSSRALGRALLPRKGTVEIFESPGGPPAVRLVAPTHGLGGAVAVEILQERGLYAEIAFAAAQGEVRVTAWIRKSDLERPTNRGSVLGLLGDHGGGMFGGEPGGIGMGTLGTMGGKADAGAPPASGDWRTYRCAKDAPLWAQERGDSRWLELGHAKADKEFRAELQPSGDLRVDLSNGKRPRPEGSASFIYVTKAVLAEAKCAALPVP